MKIKNRIVAAIAALMFASACTNPSAIALGTHDTDDTQEPMTLYTTDWLRVREYPSLEAEIIDVYAPGTAISATDVTNKYNGWIQMQYGSHKYYMHSDWLTMEKPEEPTETIITDDTTEEETPVIEESVEEESSVDDLIEVSSVDDTYIEDDCSEDTTDDSTSEEYTDYDYTEDDCSEDTTDDSASEEYTDYDYTEEDSDEYDGSYPSYWMYSPEYFEENGVIEYNGYYFTYYSELVMPGEGLYIPGRWTDEYGFVRDGNGNLCLASNTPDTMDRFSTVYTPWGLGVIYDYGTGNDAVIDVYVGW